MFLRFWRQNAQATPDNVATACIRQRKVMPWVKAIGFIERRGHQIHVQFNVWPTLYTRVVLVNQTYF